MLDLLMRIPRNGQHFLLVGAGGVLHPLTSENAPPTIGGAAIFTPQVAPIGVHYPLFPLVFPADMAGRRIMGRDVPTNKHTPMPPDPGRETASSCNCSTTEPAPAGLSPPRSMPGGLVKETGNGAGNGHAGDLCADRGSCRSRALQNGPPPATTAADSLPKQDRTDSLGQRT